VATTNRQAQSLYERAGFGLVRILRDYYGQGEHGLSLCLPLDRTPAMPDPAPTLWETVAG
jgi:ribosomal protein S18 acetylase RimI-like enzyme